MDIRDALALGLEDAEHEIRGEALVGLARRKDPRTFPALLEEWRAGEISALSIEAAEELADPNLIPYLKELHGSLDCADDQSFLESIMRALEACEGASGE